MADNYNKVREYRVKRKMTVKELANVLGCTETFVRQIESGKRGMSLSTAKQISSALGKTLDTIFMP